MALISPENLLRRPQPTQKCTLGCPVLDRCLGGGIPCNSMTELVAESASGKTQFCLQLALSAQLPPSRGGLSASSLYLHTEFPFPFRRLHQLRRAFCDRHSIGREFDPSDNVFVHAVHSADQLLDEMRKIESFLSERKPRFPVRVIVIDSIAALFRSEFDNTPFDLKRRSSLFFKISGKLKSLVDRFNVAVVVTNQVVDFMGDNGGMNGLRIGNLKYLYSSERRVCPALGLAWANCVNSRLFLSRNEEVIREENGSANAGNGDTLRRQTRRRIHVLFAPHLPESSTEFVIRREGVFGVDR
ncbi:DNA repair protein XRCC3-like protein [Morus notabilis]|uniref:DNA repair protein XRCC3-like protein n=1 Tax=Morus notabilis TaxID=981085 RepID=W9SDI8_9ROSA|nr:DNA repair protein XRCC3 homolog [Morus notabilis]EXC23982.1 DNA repair protein XRCC3-like protein [Morus notabilis]